MTEADIQAAIRLAVGRMPDVRLFRNNRGVAWMGQVIHRDAETLTLMHPRPVEFGLTNGASDLIGLKRVLVTADMIGGVVAIFCAGEVKRPKVKVPEHQRNFVDFVNTFGGIAGVVRSPDDAVDLFGARVLAGGAP